MSNTPKQRSASERIEDLERALMSLFQTADNMARDLMTVKDAMKLLNNKMDAIVKAANRPEGISDDSISAIMVENNVSELKEKVTGLVTQGILVSEDAVTENSFVVGREIDSDGKVVNPRLQFTMQALQPEVRAKIVGGTAGQTLNLEEGKLKFEVLETYSIQNPKSPETDPTPTQEEPTADAPLAEAAGS